MKTLRITAEEAKAFLDALHAKLKESACEDFISDAPRTPRGMIDIATIIREIALEAEEKRLAAGRKEKAGAAKE